MARLYHNRLGTMDPSIRHHQTLVAVRSENFDLGNLQCGLTHVMLHKYRTKGWAGVLRSVVCTHLIISLHEHDCLSQEGQSKRLPQMLPASQGTASAVRDGLGEGNHFHPLMDVIDRTVRAILLL